jgi:uncharacterized protein
MSDPVDEAGLDPGAALLAEFVAQEQAAEAAGETAEATPPGGEVSFVAPEVYIPLRFVDVVMVLPSTHPMLILQEIDEPHRQLRIPVGANEGIALAYGARQLKTPRPLTHELFVEVLESFSISIDTVRITSVTGSAYEAQLHCSGPRGAKVIECRPSDAIALVLRQRLPAPISAAPAVLDQAGFDPERSG